MSSSRFLSSAFLLSSVSALSFHFFNQLISENKMVIIIMSKFRARNKETHKKLTEVLPVQFVYWGTVTDDFTWMSRIVFICPKKFTRTEIWNKEKPVTIIQLIRAENIWCRALPPWISAVSDSVWSILSLWCSLWVRLSLLPPDCFFPLRTVLSWTSCPDSGQNPVPASAQGLDLRRFENLSEISFPRFLFSFKLLCNESGGEDSIC